VEVAASQRQQFTTSDVMRSERVTVYFKVKVTQPRAHLISRPLDHYTHAAITATVVVVVVVVVGVVAVVVVVVVVVVVHRESKKGCHPNHSYNFVNS